MKQPQMTSDPVPYEMLGMAYYRSYQENGSEEAALQAAESFGQSIRLGVQKSYMYVNAAWCWFYVGETESAYTMLDDMQQVYTGSYLPHAIRGIFYISEENQKEESERDYSAVQEEYETAKAMASANDDQTYLQMLESYIIELEEANWL